MRKGEKIQMNNKEYSGNRDYDERIRRFRVGKEVFLTLEDPYTAPITGTITDRVLLSDNYDELILTDVEHEIHQEEDTEILPEVSSPLRVVQQIKTDSTLSHPMVFRGDEYITQVALISRNSPPPNAWERLFLALKRRLTEKQI
jgi:hypothetical protein